MTLVLACALAAFFYFPKFGEDGNFSEKFSDGEIIINFSEQKDFSLFEEKDFIRVCIWNVKNYSLSFRDRLKRPKPEIEKAAICEIVAQIKPDILMLQEMGGDEFLLDLAQRLADSGEIFNYRVLQKSTLNSRLGILSKIRPKKVLDLNEIYFTYFNGETKRSPRAALGLHFESEGIEWCTFTVHLKSKYGAKKDDFEFYEYRRRELAAILEKISDESHGKDIPTLIGGDFNEDPNPQACELFEKRGFLILRNIGETPHTYHWRKESRDSTYDYFYASKNMANFLRQEGASVFTPLDITKKNAASDHRPVWVDLSFKKN